MRYRKNTALGGIILIVIGLALVFPAILQNILLILGIYFIYIGFCNIQKNFNRR